MQKILIANRGEIAMRILRTAKEMGIKTVAVYSSADRTAPHVRFADETIYLGPPPSSESYLLGDSIIAKAKELGVDGIHPGYGFLSENAEFAKKVTEAGITFIGPSPEAIETMGSKLAAKETVKAYDVPMVPGVDRAVTDIQEAKTIAKQVGFPILVKASAGGGGKGMRVVEKMEDLEEQMTRAISEATSAFGDGSVFIEKFISSPRHIEIQVLADNHGNVVHLFERECSIQRRHQKVIEEAPSALLTPEVRKAMGKAAVDVAKSCNYSGAGTVEFLVDSDLNFYFLEMNTRLQVEHPVSELITGVDLVRQQIEIARGHQLPFTQEDLSISGHAMEVRVYAEDPANNFLPSVGKLNRYETPKGPGVRVDDGYEEGMDIPIFYDPMLAKLITYGKDRTEAIDRMVRAIDEYKIDGIKTTLPFGKYVMQNSEFKAATIDTQFVSKHFTSESLNDYVKEEAEIAAGLSVWLTEQSKKESTVVNSSSSQKSGWKSRAKH